MRNSSSRMADSVEQMSKRCIKMHAIQPDWADPDFLCLTGYDIDGDEDIDLAEIAAFERVFGGWG